MLDITIIGGGPNGIYCFKKMKDIFKNNILLIEKDSVVSNIKKYPDLIWHSPKSELCFDTECNNNTHNPTNSEIINYYEDYVKRNNINYMKGEVTNIEKNEDYYKIHLHAIKDIICTKYIILCTGIFENKNLLNLNTNYPYISYDYPDFSITNKNLVLIGGGNSSIDYIIYLLPHNKITWIMRTTYTRNSAHLQKCQSIMSQYNHNLTMYENTTVTNFSENNSILLSNQSNVENIDYCNILIGFNSKNSLYNKIGIQYDNFNNIKRDEHYQTNLQNIYIFGSLATQQNDIVYIHNGNPSRLDKIIDSISSTLL